MSDSDRLDVLVSKISGMSRSVSRELVLNGKVTVNGKIIKKPGTKIIPEGESDNLIKIDASPPKYVSRGGYKLEKALEFFNLNLEGMICLDAGSSTGGFTDCMLHYGAKKVYAVDCGQDQLNEKLRGDTRVASFEKTNIRHINSSLFPEPVNFAAADLSFISLSKAILPISESIVPGSKIICLLKPQFEAGRKALNKRGIVTDPVEHVKCIEYICDFCTLNLIDVLGITRSPIKGSDGNTEYLILLSSNRDGLQSFNHKSLHKKLAKEVVNEKNRCYT